MRKGRNKMQLSCGHDSEYLEWEGCPYDNTKGRYYKIDDMYLKHISQFKCAKCQSVYIGGQRSEEEDLTLIRT